MKKLAIVCGAPSTEMMAPFDDETYQIWALAFRLDFYPRFDRLFDVHDGDSHVLDFDKYQKLLDAVDCPVVTGANPALKCANQIEYPFSEVKDMFGSLYLTSSCSYMLAMAILEGFEHIEIYGVDLGVDDDEYFYQRPCFESWVGFAKGRGINVVIPEQSSCLKASFLYGAEKSPFATDDPFNEKGLLEMSARHQEQCDRFEQQIRQMQINIAAHDGSRQVYEKLAKIARATQAGQKIGSIREHLLINE